MNKNKTEDTAVRPALFDRIFKPRTITLSNGENLLSEQLKAHAGPSRCPTATRCSSPFRARRSSRPS